DGKWQYFFEDGKLQAEETYKEGKLNGKRVTYFANGKKESEENKYLKDLTKFDYNLLVARMTENLPQSILNSAYVYIVDGVNALKIAKSTQNYVIDQIGNGKYCVLTPSNVAPDLNPLTYAYTIMTESLKNTKEVFKSVVNFRALGISSFSITHPNGYVICFGLYTSEGSAKSFYYAQDWIELSKYGYVKGAKVIKIGR
ncbi:MAG: toxin-antitoxin system YwqK family antitoxin, partial [Fervidobacterium sp.]